ncbi:MAG: tRNA pseudouridine(55) synthase TruB, partial [Alphaproteobacteria bacterium]
MSRRKGKSVNGWIIVDKPVSVTSTQVVSLLRRGLDAKKCGHSGTLDPLASGVLPVAFGEATKIIPLVMEGPKTYEFTVQWGEERSTDDAEGVVTGRSLYRPKEAD